MKFFVSIIWGYSETTYDLSAKENYHFHILKIAKECGYKIIIISKDAEIIKNDPHLDRDTVVLDYRNLSSYLWNIIRYSLKDSVFYVNSCEWKSYIVPIFTRRAIFMGHTQPKRQNQLKQTLQDISFKLFKGIRLNNDDERDFLLKRGVEEGKLFVIPLVVAQDVFKIEETKKPRTDIVYFGGVTAKKNLSTILKAFKDIILQKPEIKLHIIGDILDKNFIPVVSELDLRDSVIIHGHMAQNNKLTEILNSMFISVNSSRDEGQCVSVYDTALCGCVLCLPNIMSFTGVFKDKALFHDVNDYKQLAKNIMQYLEKNDIVNRFQTQCIEMIQNNYNEEIIEKKLKDLIKRI